jgi:DNA mismatch repair protein MutL
MPEIRVLPEKVANQIAAGEVVERPAAVVKELLENSLDAGATRVSVEFSNGGKSFIAIEDNGCGMTPDQALMALEMHATSKIRTAEDLNEVGTFGFRGEAVPSIASVSRFTLRTRPADALAGTELLVNAGKLLYQREAGMAPGTRIEVANLFHPVPARLKFLKSENTEAAHITRLTRLYAVAQPTVGFLLSEDGSEIFRSPSGESLLERVREIWGNQLAADLVEFAPVETAGMRLHGLLGKPGAGRMTRQEMVTIVNGRPVDSRTLAYSLVESYHTLLPRGRYPLAFLFLEIDPHWVDVNVHPAKREIRFRDEARVRRFVITEVLRHLDALNPGAATAGGVGGSGGDGVGGNIGVGVDSATPEEPAQGDGAKARMAAVAAGTGAAMGAETGNGATTTSELPGGGGSGGSSGGSGADNVNDNGRFPAATTASWEQAQATAAMGAATQTAAAGGAFSDATADNGGNGAGAGNVTGAVNINGNGGVTSNVAAASNVAGGVNRAPENETRFRLDWRLAGRLADGLFLFEAPGGLVVFNLRAARERVGYERILRQLGDHSTPSQQLLLPIPLELEPLPASVLRERLATLEAAGFSIEEFGRNFFRILAVPDWLSDADVLQGVRDIVDELGRRAGEFQRSSVLHDYLARLAASRVGRAAGRESDEMVFSVARELFLCRQPTVCPNGKPVFFELPHSELARRLGKL